MILLDRNNGRLEIKTGSYEIFSSGESTPVSTDNYTPNANTRAYYPLTDYLDHTSNNLDLDSTSIAGEGGWFSTTPDLNGTSKFGGVCPIFNGTTDVLYQKIAAPCPANTNFTISLWVKRDGSVDGKTLVGNGTGQEYACGVFMDFTGNYLRQGIYNACWGGTTDVEISTNWTNVIYTRGTGNYKTYINGVLSTDNAGCAGGVPIANCIIGGLKYIGLPYAIPAWGLTDMFKGQICEVIYENIEWTQTEVDNYYNPRA